MDTELSKLKTLSIEAYAASLGYVRDPKKSSKQFAVLRRSSDNDKLLVRTDADGHSVYRCERHHADRGSILDFAMTRLGINLGAARRELRAWANLSFPLCPNSFSTQPKVLLSTNEPDRQTIAAAWNAATWIPEHPYLLFRQIPRSTLIDPRFFNCWRRDKIGNAIFLHHDLEGICGYERRNRDFKGMGEGSHKGLWVSSNIKSCSRLVICESPINCLSFHALQVDATDALWPLGYAAFGGGMSSSQKELLSVLIRRSLDRGVSIKIGTDLDPAGDGYANLLMELAQTKLERIVPVGKDFNHDLVWCAKEDS